MNTTRSVAIPVEDLTVTHIGSPSCSYISQISPKSRPCLSVLEYHVRELALAPPPTDAKLAEQVARIFSRPLDRSRPLWEVYLIHGLRDRRVALLTKIHHSVIDGMSGAEILGVLLDLTPEGREPPP